MLSLALIGLVGGLVAGISPCILPVLPVIFMSGGTEGAGTGSRNLTPYAVVGGLVLSFSVFTLLGALILSALPVPQDTIRWVGIVVLVLLGLGMIVPPLERILERPFSRLRLGNGGTARRGSCSVWHSARSTCPAPGRCWPRSRWPARRGRSGATRSCSR